MISRGAFGGRMSGLSTPPRLGSPVSKTADAQAGNVPTLECRVVVRTLEGPRRALRSTDRGEWA